MTFPTDLKKRNTFILDCVLAEDFELEWVPLTYSAEGNIAIFNVSADALKIEGVRVNVTAYLQQQIADVLDASLLTPRLADILHLNADIVIPPLPRAIAMSTEVMIDQSRQIDAAIVSVVGSLSAAKNRLVSTVGKHWVLDAQLLSQPKRAVNYGWHVPGISYKGVRAYPCTIPGSNIGVIQPNATAHTPEHTDYSQVCVLVQRHCQVNGEITTLDAILSNPSLAYLASHQGVLKVRRQPGV